ncbi:hypothetical protein BDW22DRAFT_1352165 [Trametopsis cervina]|nr:hypothetical protein BDW22DRAFT_1352165 [Trametopsis cervina]
MDITAEPEEIQASDKDAPQIIDCDVLEAAKENIQPLAKGRRVTALSAILATPHAKRETQLSATRRRLRMNVDIALEDSTPAEGEEEDSDADPLEAYCSYVYWVVENYPQGHSAESGLLELLEEATRVLKDHQGGKWRNDIRYLKLWVLYASYVEKPNIVFKFCMINEIGTDHALLYEEAALALERSGRKSEADDTYRLGIARRVDPLERLEARYHEFQKRMLASPTLPSNATPAEDTAQASGTPAASGSRRVLGDASASSSHTTRTTRSSTRLASSASPSIPAVTPVPSRPQPNARIAVFVDTPVDASSPHANNEEQAPSAWPELGTRKSRIKENVKEATKAAGSTLKQSGRSHRVASGGTPKISVFVDPTPDEAHEDNQAPEVKGSPSPPNPPAKVAKAGSSKSIPVFRDDAQETQTSSKLKPAKGIAVFRDDEPEPSQKPKKTKPVKGIAVFQDNDPEPTVAGPSSVKPSKLPKPKVSSKSPMAVFCDDPQDPPVEPKKVKPSLGKPKAKESIPVFRDESVERGSPPQDEQQSAVNKLAFQPFKDEDATVSNVDKNKTVGLGILGLGAAATRGSSAVKMSSEAEALRKDPLKNYPDDQKTADLAL